MSNEFTMTTGQAHEVAQAFGRNGWNNEQVKQLSEGDFLKQVLDALLGRAEIKPVEHIIDLGADPFLPDSWKVEEHQKGKVAKFERKGDNLYLDGKKIGFYLSKKQKGGAIVGNDLRTELAEQPVLNANVLDYLLKNPLLIPDEWKTDENRNTRYIFFWGTVYRGADGGLYVRYLGWHGGRWGWGCVRLGYGFDDRSPAAVSAS